MAVLNRELDDTLSINQFDKEGRLFIAFDYHGRYINYEDSSRHTSYQPDRWTHTVWLFGNSALVSPMMIDSDTIPSQLQLLLNQYGYGWRVVNKGITAYTAKQELAHLKETTIQPGDMVIFYDGVKEADTINLSLSREFRKNNPVGWVCDQLHELALSRFFCDDVNNTAFGSCEMPGKAAADDYQQTITEAHDYAQSQGAAFYVMLQPHLYTRPLSTIERSLEAELILTNNAKRWGLLTCWSYIQAGVEQLRQHGIAAVDLTHAVDWSRRQTSVWYDMTHATGKGNTLIAQAIFNAMTTF
ncbi:MAG: hypothetical protein ABI947_06140 [Chloroflexota bacterium]